MKKVDELEGKNIFVRVIKKLNSIQFGLDEEKEYFIENLSMLLAAGINVTSALSSIKVGMKSPYMKKVVEDLKTDIEAGSSLWGAFAKTDLLPEHIIVLFRIGEMTGKLPENLKLINIQQQKERIFKAKIKSAMMYPVLVMTLTATIGIGIAWFILPRLSSVFASLRLDLPWITKLLIQLGNFLGEYGLVVIPLFLTTLFLLIYFVFIYRKTNYIGQWILFRIPGIKDLIQQTELSRFGHIMGQLLVVNLPVTDAVDSLKSSTTVLVYKKLYIHMREQIEIGSSFQQAFNSYPDIDRLIPAPIQQMISSGEQSGCLPKLLKTIGEVFEEKTDSTAKNLSTILEPLLLIVIWGGVMSVALAVLLPIYSLIGGIGKGPPKPKRNNTKTEKTIEAPKPTVQPKSTYPTTQQGKAGNKSAQERNNHQREVTDDGLTKVDIFKEEEFDRRDWTPTELKTDGANDMIYTSYEALETKIDQAQVQIDKKAKSIFSAEESPQDIVEGQTESDVVPEEMSESEEVESKKVTDSSEKIINEDILDFLPTTELDISTSLKPVIVVDESDAVVPVEDLDLSEKKESSILHSIRELVIPSGIPTFMKVEEPETSADIIQEDSLLIRVSPQDSQAFIQVQTGIRMLNVREYPTTWAKILKQIYPGETYEYTEVQNGWYKIIYSEEVMGWVSGKYTTEIIK